MDILIDWDQTREITFIFPWEKKKKKKNPFTYYLRNYIYNYLRHPWYLFLIDNHKIYN